jgi:hypothetical protein
LFDYNLFINNKLQSDQVVIPQITKGVLALEGGTVWSFSAKPLSIIRKCPESITAKISDHGSFYPVVAKPV